MSPTILQDGMETFSSIRKRFTYANVAMTAGPECSP